MRSEFFEKPSKKFFYPRYLGRMAVEAKLPDKPYYTIAEIAEATGIPRTTLDVERRAGRLKSFLPDGQQRGILVKCDWFDAWMRAGCR